MTGPRQGQGQSRQGHRATRDRASTGPQGHAWQDVRAGAELARWRRVQGWTQTQAAQWYGITLRQWQRYEASAEIPANLTRLIAWRERLGDQAGLP